MRYIKLTEEQLKNVISDFIDEQLDEMENDPCWKGYEMVGKKMKNGKEVPNCVPKKKPTK